jgi:hypothetical protein
MAIENPGNLGKGYCLKCKTPMMIDLPDENAVRLLCLDCTKEVQHLIRHSKSNANLKRFVIHGKTFKPVDTHD